MEVVYGFSYRRLSLGPWQIGAELAAFLKLVEELRAETILEIGTGLGGTTVLLTRAAAEDAVVVSVDLPPRPGARALLAAGARGSQQVHCLRADSHASTPETWCRESWTSGSRHSLYRWRTHQHRCEARSRALRPTGPAGRLERPP